MANSNVSIIKIMMDKGILKANKKKIKALKKSVKSKK
jgi:hypothetical protein